MEEIGMVVATEGDKAKVQLQFREACKSCRGCNPTEGFAVIEADNSLGAKVSQRVKVWHEVKPISAEIIFVYAVPMIMLLAGIFGGSYLADSLGLKNYGQTVGFVAGIILFFASFFLANLYYRSHQPKSTKKAVITEVIKEETNEKIS